MNLIFGSGGFAKEIDWLIYDVFNKTNCDYRPDYFVVKEGDPMIGSRINEVAIINESDLFNKVASDNCNCFIAVGEPNIKKLIVNKIKSKLVNYQFPNLIHPDVTFDNRVGKFKLGYGNIICSKSVLTTDIQIGNFVTVNLACTLGHESSIGDYSTLSPGVHISGNVHIGESVYIGTGAVSVQNVSICDDCIIGASSVINKSLIQPGTYIGIPARKFK